MSKRLETLDRKVIYILARVGIPVKKKIFLKILKKLREKGVNLGIEIYELNNELVSPTLDEIVDKLVERGYLRVLYTLDKSDYGGLYTEVYSPTDKAKKMLEKPKFGKKDKKTIDQVIERLRRRSRG
ncbi:MAG: hypothetical protein DRJ51_07340 [Thermoprotei archaeon]|nr:MAG: hypothetical protein DRJ51_07340 [Thermoprotei archaeon]RLE79720.1 MAG: hypothetical protein DRJ36_03025 [Thermoprotei archaeon]